MTIKDIRKKMRAMDGHNYSEALLIEGWGQIKKIGKSYCIGPLPEDDDSDPYTDYSAWSCGLKESWVLDYIRHDLKIA